MSSGGSPERITFDAPVVGVPTRATEIVSNFPKDQDFAVYALYHEGAYGDNSFTSGSIYMTNVTCKAQMADGSEVGTKTPDYWAPAANYYWPKNDNAKLTFAAYTPVMTAIPDGDTGAAVGVKWGDTGFKFQNFKVNDDPAQQIDLLYSAREYDKTSESMLALPGTDPTPDNHADPYGGITITFKHALSSIVFMAQTEGTISNATIKITGIEVKNVVNTGDFAQNLTAERVNDSNIPTWNVKPGADNANVKNYTVRASNFASNKSDGVALSENAIYVKGEPTNANGKRRSDLILIPQVLNETGRVVSVVIKYTIQNGTETPVENEKTFDLAVADTDADTDANPTYVWEVGKRYTYTIVVGLEKIYFNPTVSDWTPATGTGIENDQPDTTI